MAAEGKRERIVDIAALSAGVVFHGAYEVVRCIKAGGMGAVYEVKQKNTERLRALKVMLPSLVSDPEMRARFELEAKVAAGIESEHIVETLDAGVDDATGMPFIVMELLKGEELGKMLKERKRLPPDEVVTLLHQAALALDRTHAAAIVHRDLKPENLFITHRDDGSPRLKILDFGVAKIIAEGTVTSYTTKSVGSPLYMAPEQIAGEKIGPGVDRYALAHIAFTLLVGKPYWHRERKAAEGLYPYLMQVVQGAKVGATKRAADMGVILPPEFDAWFDKATARHATDRFDGSVEQIAALADAFDVSPPSTVALPPPRMPLPSILVTGESSRSIVPPSSGTTLSAPTVLERKSPVVSDPEPAAPVPEPPPSLQDPSSAALTRTSEIPSPSANAVQPKRRSSLAPIVAVLLLAAGVASVFGAFVIWPHRMPVRTNAAATDAPDTVTPSTPATAGTPDAVPVALSSVPEPATSASAEPSSSAEPITSASASAAGSADKPGGAPSGSASATGKWPSWKDKSKTRPNGKNPLDEY